MRATLFLKGTEDLVDLPARTEVIRSCRQAPRYGEVARGYDPPPRQIPAADATAALHSYFWRDDRVAYGFRTVLSDLACWEAEIRLT